MTTAPAHQVVLDRADFPALSSRARRLAGRGCRALLGITGAPGAGKSTLAEDLVDGLDGFAVLLPMDGFHYAQRVLRELGREERKGAPDTFDAAGFVHLLRRIRAGDEPVVYAPTFRRDLEEPIAGAIPIPHGVPLVVVEGNYLLADRAAWAPVAGLLDETWYLSPDPQVRLRRLVDRHMSYGRSREVATARATGSDQVNAEVIEATRSRADVIVVG
jgi:pantothenate kinase